MRNNRNSLSRRALFMLAAGLSITAAPGHATDGYFLHGIGAAAKGNGGVAIALPQDAAAVATNPATATEIEHRLDVGVDIFIPDRGAEIAGNQFGLDGQYSGNGANPFVLGDVAYVRPLSDRVSVGITLFANGGMNTVYKQNPLASFGETRAAGVDLKQGFIVPSVAVKLDENHSLGASAVGLVQSFRAYGAAPFAMFSQDPASFSDRGDDWAFGAGFKLGYYGKLSERLSVGAYYQSKVDAGKFDKYAGLFENGGDFDVPPSWGIGAALKLTDDLTVGADFKRIEYSVVEAVGNSISIVNDGVPFGAADGPGFGWQDISVYKLGAVWQASDTLTLRAGYGRSENPIPAEETLMNVFSPGVVEDHFTVGATVALGGNLEVTAHAMRAPRNDVAGSGSIAPGFGGGEANIYLAETSFGAALGVKF